MWSVVALNVSFAWLGHLQASGSQSAQNTRDTNDIRRGTVCDASVQLRNLNSAACVGESSKQTFFIEQTDTDCCLFRETAAATSKV